MARLAGISATWVTPLYSCSRWQIGSWWQIRGRESGMGRELISPGRLSSTFRLFACDDEEW